MAELKVGGEVDAFCTRCKMLLAHTVLAIWAGQIKRVRCNTCMGEHAFRKAEPGGSGSGSTGSKPSRPHAATAAKARAVVEETSSYEELIAGKDRSTARPFNIKQRFAIGDLVKHPTFGLGVVAATRGLDKIDVAFPGTVKTLQHNKDGGPAALAKPLPSKRPDVVVEGEADAGDGSDGPEGAVGR